MKRNLLLALLFSTIAMAQQKTTTFFLIRHAEKATGSGNPDLSEAGKARANHWNEVFSATRLDAIYSTDYNRTRQTADPVAQSKNVGVTLYDPEKLTATQLRKAYYGQTVLIVGHSNTIPALVNQLIEQDTYPMMEENVFGNLYIVTFANGAVSHQLLKSL